MSKKNRSFDFWKQINVSTWDKCWLWTGAKHKQSYGLFTFAMKRYLAHRFMWLITHHNLPEDMSICHKCDNPLCVNPDHLFLGTHRDNMMDAKKKQRFARGEKTAQAKLKDNHVREIKRLYKEGGLTQVELSKIFKVDKAGISRIISGKLWAHVK